MEDAVIVPKAKVKVLGVILDKKLTFKDHIVEKAAYKGTAAALALKRMKGLRPTTARQLFISTVTAVTDYASPVWSPAISGKVKALLDRVQRIEAQSILGMFKSVALPIAEAEASIDSVQLRHEIQLARFWINLHTLPKDNPLWKTQKQLKITKRFCSPMAQGIEKLKLGQLDKMEKINGHCLPPKQLETDREKAKWIAQNTQGIKIAVNCSCRNNLIGVGASYGLQITQHRTISSSQKLNVYLGELYAIQWVVKALTRTIISGFPKPVRVVILSDSQSALKALRNPSRQSGQWLLRKIIMDIDKLKKKAGHTVSLCWVPGHAKVKENEEADSAARAATEEGKSPEEELPLPKSVALREITSNLRTKSQKFATRVGKFTRDMDHALPGNHTRKLYDRLNREQAGMLSQLRTGKNKLNYYLAKARIRESSVCECLREPETVSHFILRCPRWNSQRARMLNSIGKHTGDLSTLLGGWDPRIVPDKGKWHPDQTAVGATIQYVKDTGRFEQEAQEQT